MLLIVNVDQCARNLPSVLPNTILNFENHCGKTHCKVADEHDESPFLKMQQRN